MSVIRKEYPENNIEQVEEIAGVEADYIVESHWRDIVIISSDDLSEFEELAKKSMDIKMEGYQVVLLLPIKIINCTSKDTRESEICTKASKGGVQILSSVSNFKIKP